MSIRRARFATAPVVAAMAALAVGLLLLIGSYGYHRDELYFRLLPPAWGYTDQPPLTPLLVHAAIAVFGDSVVALRIVALLCAVASVAILALITREAGGGSLAQALTAFGMAGASMTLTFGHVLLTASLDLVVWPAALLFVIRALLRDDGRWWLAAGAVVGASTYNKLLIATLLVALAVGLAVFGPWKWFRSGWLWAAIGVVALIALPNVVFQATHGWPQLAMGAALAVDNAAEVRTLMWPFLILMVGPVLAVFWVVALVGLFRRPRWRPIRLLAVAFIVIVIFVFVAGTQFYYTFGMLSVLVALGSVPVAEWARTRARRVTLFALIVVNTLGCAIASVPLLPVEVFGAAGLTNVNQAAGDQVGWERYAAQIQAVSTAAAPDAIITANYGEAGALDRFGTDLPPVVSGQNALWDLGGPPADASTVVLVGDFDAHVQALFGSCRTADRLDNGVGVDNEEQDVPIRICTDPVAAWSQLWPMFRHLD